LIEGEVALRSAERRNPELATGDVEVRALSISVVGPASRPAIPVARGKGEKLRRRSFASGTDTSIFDAPSFRRTSSCGTA